MTPGSDFDWDGARDEGDLVIPHQAATAVYANPHGHVVIRQEGHHGPDEDAWIVIAPANARRVATAILRCAARLAGEEEPEAVAPAERAAPRDATAADRMRRYRQRQRNEGRNGERNADRNGTVVELPFLPPSDEEDMHALAR